ncbi:hypothetical protein MP228_009838 [Amoeboaphelidium protococcarum]|nr:hypothetical protein MP228_009838 [Amoeboaphelidium protococcarum]
MLKFKLLNVDQLEQTQKYLDAFQFRERKLGLDEVIQGVSSNSAQNSESCLYLSHYCDLKSGIKQKSVGRIEEYPLEFASQSASNFDAVILFIQHSSVMNDTFQVLSDIEQILQLYPSTQYKIFAFEPDLQDIDNKQVLDRAYNVNPSLKMLNESIIIVPNQSDKVEFYLHTFLVELCKDLIKKKQQFIQYMEKNQTLLMNYGYTVYTPDVTAASEDTSQLQSQQDQLLQPPKSATIGGGRRYRSDLSTNNSNLSYSSLSSYNEQLKDKKRLPHRIMVQQGHLLFSVGDIAKAVALYNQALDTMKNISDPLYSCLTLEALLQIHFLSMINKLADLVSSQSSNTGDDVKSQKSINTGGRSDKDANPITDYAAKLARFINNDVFDTYSSINELVSKQPFTQYSALFMLRFASLLYDIYSVFVIKDSYYVPWFCAEQSHSEDDDDGVANGGGKSEVGGRLQALQSAGVTGLNVTKSLIIEVLSRVALPLLIDLEEDGIDSRYNVQDLLVMYSFMHRLYSGLGCNRKALLCKFYLAVVCAELSQTSILYPVLEEKSTHTPLSASAFSKISPIVDFFPSASSNNNQSSSQLQSSSGLFQSLTSSYQKVKETDLDPKISLVKYLPDYYRVQLSLRVSSLIDDVYGHYKKYQSSLNIVHDRKAKGYFSPLQSSFEILYLQASDSLMVGKGWLNVLIYLLYSMKDTAYSLNHLRQSVDISLDLLRSNVVMDGDLLEFVQKVFNKLSFLAGPSVSSHNGCIVLRSIESLSQYSQQHDQSGAFGNLLSEFSITPSDVQGGDRVYSVQESINFKLNFRNPYPYELQVEDISIIVVSENSIETFCTFEYSGALTLQAQSEVVINGTFQCLLNSSYGTVMVAGIRIQLSQGWVVNQYLDGGFQINQIVDSNNMLSLTLIDDLPPLKLGSQQALVLFEGQRISCSVQMSPKVDVVSLKVTVQDCIDTFGAKMKSKTDVDVLAKVISIQDDNVEVQICGRLGLAGISLLFELIQSDGLYSRQQVITLPVEVHKALDINSVCIRDFSVADNCCHITANLANLSSKSMTVHSPLFNDSGINIAAKSSIIIDVKIPSISINELVKRFSQYCDQDFNEDDPLGDFPPIPQSSDVKRQYVVANESGEENYLYLYQRLKKLAKELASNNVAILYDLPFHDSAQLIKKLIDRRDTISNVGLDRPDQLSKLQVLCDLTALSISREYDLRIAYWLRRYCMEQLDIEYSFAASTNSSLLNHINIQDHLDFSAQNLSLLIKSDYELKVTPGGKYQKYQLDQNGIARVTLRIDCKLDGFENNDGDFICIFRYRIIQEVCEADDEISFKLDYTAFVQGSQELIFGADSSVQDIDMIFAGRGQYKLVWHVEQIRSDVKRNNDGDDESFDPVKYMNMVKWCTQVILIDIQ